MINDDLLFIQKVVEETTGYKLLKNTRQREYVLARMMFYSISRLTTKHPLIKIGKHLNKDHATVLHNLGNVERDLIKDTSNSEVYLETLKMCKNILSKHSDELDEKEKLCIITAELSKMKLENKFLRLEIQSLMMQEDENENRLLQIFRDMQFSDKMDLIFKARTILKVRNKLSA